MDTPIKCVMCHNRNAMVLPNVQDRHGSVKKAAFCSLVCAARWGLIHLNNEMHLCPVTNQWLIDMDGCPECKPDRF